MSSSSVLAAAVVVVVVLAAAAGAVAFEHYPDLGRAVLDSADPVQDQAVQAAVHRACRERGLVQEEGALLDHRRPNLPSAAAAVIAELLAIGSGWSVELAVLVLSATAADVIQADCDRLLASLFRIAEPDSTLAPYYLRVLERLPPGALSSSSGGSLASRFFEHRLLDWNHDEAAAAAAAADDDDDDDAIMVKVWAALRQRLSPRDRIDVVRLAAERLPPAYWSAFFVDDVVALLQTAEQQAAMMKWLAATDACRRPFLIEWAWRTLPYRDLIMVLGHRPPPPPPQDRPSDDAASALARLLQDWIESDNADADLIRESFLSRLSPDQEPIFFQALLDVDESVRGQGRDRVEMIGHLYHLLLQRLALSDSLAKLERPADALRVVLAVAAWSSTSRHAPVSEIANESHGDGPDERALWAMLEAAAVGPWASTPAMGPFRLLVMCAWPALNTTGEFLRRAVRLGADVRTQLLAAVLLRAAESAPGAAADVPAPAPDRIEDLIRALLLYSKDLLLPDGSGSDLQMPIIDLIMELVPFLSGPRIAAIRLWSAGLGMQMLWMAAAAPADYSSDYDGDDDSSSSDTDQSDDSVVDVPPDDDGDDDDGDDDDGILSERHKEFLQEVKRGKKQCNAAIDPNSVCSSSSSGRIIAPVSSSARLPQ